MSIPPNQLINQPMSDRFSLIARKNEVRRQIEQLRRQLAREQAKALPASKRKLDQLESKLEQLMAEEYNLRMAIDQSK